jgi:DNA-binding transcriptional MerR regulator
MRFEDAMLVVGANEWSGTAAQLVAEIDRRLGADFSGLVKPSLRTVRLWRSKGLLSDSGKRVFNGRQLLESLAVLFMQSRGWNLAAIADHLPKLNDSELAARVASGPSADWSPSASASSNDPGTVSGRAASAAEVGAVLLAQGVLRLYDRVLAGREIVRQDDSLPPEIHQAMCKLGRLYIEEGQMDRAGCVHDLLDRARTPFREWNLQAFSEPAFRFRDATLVDPELRVPTQDAIAVATSGGWGLDDIIEHQLHTRLREMADKLGPGRTAAYTKVREFVARRSLATESEVRQWFDENRISPIQNIIDDLYDRVPEAWLISGLAHRCAWCGTLLRPHPDRASFPEGKCPLRQCVSKHNSRAAERLQPTGLLVCRPQVLTYWTGPAVDELEVFDAAQQAGLDPELYPDGDRCDVAIGNDRVGIDVKCYTSPVSLAVRFNSGIGGLASYSRRIVAIPDYLAHRPGYLDSFASSLNPSRDTATLEIRNIGWLLEKFREGSFIA